MRIYPGLRFGVQGVESVEIRLLASAKLWLLFEFILRVIDDTLEERVADPVTPDCRVEFHRLSGMNDELDDPTIRIA